jgi:hypothetical protein
MIGSAVQLSVVYCGIVLCSVVVLLLLSPFLIVVCGVVYECIVFCGGNRAN